jgi:hypothetical protein
MESPSLRQLASSIVVLQEEEIDYYAENMEDPQFLLTMLEKLAKDIQKLGILKSDYTRDLFRVNLLEIMPIMGGDLESFEGASLADAREELLKLAERQVEELTASGRFSAFKEEIFASPRYPPSRSDPVGPIVWHWTILYYAAVLATIAVYYYLTFVMSRERQSAAEDPVSELFESTAEEAAGEVFEVTDEMAREVIARVEEMTRRNVAAILSIPEEGVPWEPPAIVDPDLAAAAESQWWWETMGDDIQSYSSAAVAQFRVIGGSLSSMAGPSPEFQRELRERTETFVDQTQTRETIYQASVFPLGGVDVSGIDIPEGVRNASRVRYEVLIRPFENAWREGRWISFSDFVNLPVFPVYASFLLSYAPAVIMRLRRMSQYVRERSWTEWAAFWGAHVQSVWSVATIYALSRDVDLWERIGLPRVSVGSVTAIAGAIILSRSMGVGRIVGAIRWSLAAITRSGRPVQRRGRLARGTRRRIEAAARLSDTKIRSVLEITGKDPQAAARFILRNQSFV